MVTAREVQLVLLESNDAPGANLELTVQDGLGFGFRV